MLIVSGAQAAARGAIVMVTSLLVGALAGLMAVAGGTKSLAVVPGLALVGAMILTPNSAMYAIVATTPINVEIAGPITVSRLAILLGAITVYVQAVRHQIAFPRLVIGWGGGLATAFFAWALVATVAHGTGGLLGRFGPFLIFAAIFFVVLNYADSTARIRNLFVLLALVGLLQAFLVLAEAMFGFSPFTGWQQILQDDLAEGEVRVVGTSAHPIILAGFFQVVMGMTVMLLLCGRDRRWQLVCLAILGLSFVGWWLTFSRSSWIGTATMLFVAMVLASRFTRRVAITGAIVGLAILSAFDFSPAKVISFVESFGSISAASATAGVATGSESFSWRTENWQAAFAIFLDNPLFGAGLDASQALMLEYLPRGALAHRFIGPEVPHNMFLLILAETGLISFALFVALWVYAFMSLARVFHMQRYRPFAIALAAIMAGQIATFFFNPIPREIWLTMALSMALGRAAQLETFRQAAPALSPAPSPAAQPQARPRQARSRRPVRRATRPGSRPA